MKKILSFALVSVFVLTAAVGCGQDESKVLMLISSEQETEFCNLAEETQEMLDIVADSIFLEWYDYVYEDKYEDVDSAIIAATDANEENIYKILENTEKLNVLYKDIRDGDLKEEVKAVMQAYNEYYSFVIEVSGSFNDFSANKENLKKALSTAIKNLSIEL